MKTLDAKRIEELNKLYFGNQSIEDSENKAIEKIDTKESKKTDDFITEWQVEEPKGAK